MTRVPALRILSSDLYRLVEPYEPRVSEAISTPSRYTRPITEVPVTTGLLRRGDYEKRPHTERAGTFLHSLRMLVGLPPALGRRTGNSLGLNRKERVAAQGLHGRVLGAHPLYGLVVHMAL